AVEKQQALALAAANKVLFVNQNVTGGNKSGDSWGDAMPELFTALHWASENWNAETDGTLQIWVAAGLYYPTDDLAKRNESFRLINGVEIYGGFSGVETTLEERDWKQYKTILSGDIGADDTQAVIDDPNPTGMQIVGNNSYNVV